MPKKFKEKESYTHKYAKELLWSWLTDGWENDDNRFSPRIDIEYKKTYYSLSYQSDFIHMEYPITKTFPYLLDELVCNEFNGCMYREPKTFMMCKELNSPKKYSPCLKCKEFMKKEKLLAVADIAIEHKGYIIYIFEITHKNMLSPEKIELYQTKPPFQVFVIEAQHILGQIKKPSTLHAKLVI